MHTTLTQSDYESAAKKLGCSVAAIKAVAEVEASGGGFLADGRLKVLFEGHVFSRYTKHRFDKSHPAISYPKWDKTKYAKGKDAEERGVKELDRLQEAMKLDHTAALMSASYSMFQIMGFNFAACGHTSVEEFLLAMSESAGRQLEAFCDYILHVGLDDELRDRKWAAFAKKYNGPGYRQNNYDRKLESAYLTYYALQKTGG